MPAETTALGSFVVFFFFLSQDRPDQDASAAAAADPAAAPVLFQTRLGAVKVTGRCLIVSEDNLTSRSLSCCALTPLSLSRTRCTNSNYWICIAKGTRAGGTPTDAHRAAATPQI